MSARQGRRKDKAAKVVKSARKAKPARKAAAPAKQARRVKPAVVVETVIETVAAPVETVVSTATAAEPATTGLAAGALTLAAHCTLREAVAMKAQLLEWLDNGADVEVDGSAVEKIDTAGLQLLVAFSRQLRDNHRGFTWKSAAPELHRAAAQLGLTGPLGLPAEVAP